MQVEEIERQLQESSKNAAQRVEVEYHESMNRESMLQKAVAETKAEFDRLNARSFEYQNLKREADADKSLYEELVRKIKEAGINAGFQNSSIRIADPARAAIRPVFPNMKLNVLLAFLFSTLLAVGFAVLTDLLDSSVRDPEQVHTLFQTDVLGSLPMVKTWRRGLVSAIAGEPGSTALVRWRGDRGSRRRTAPSPALKKPCAPCATRFCWDPFDRRLRSLMITSATPAEGKTTTAVHLAIAHAQQKHKTLLIDCDLRRPGVHSKLGNQSGSGTGRRSAERDAVAREAGEAAGTGRSGYPAHRFSSRRAADLIGRRLAGNPGRCRQ